MGKGRGKGGETVEEQQEQRIYVGYVCQLAALPLAVFLCLSLSLPLFAIGARPRCSSECDACRGTRSWAVYGVLIVQMLSWIYISQDPTPRLKRKAWLDFVIYGCYVSAARSPSRASWPPAARLHRAAPLSLSLTSWLW